MTETSGEPGSIDLTTGPAAVGTRFPAPSYVMGILLLALVVRALAFLSAGEDSQRFVTIDSPDYVTLAFNFQAAYFEPDSPLFSMGLFRTPGYPAFLAAILISLKGSLFFVALAQIGLAVVTVYLTLRLALTLLGPRAAVFSGIVLALDPVSALYPSLIQPEALFTFFLVAGVTTWLAAIEGAGAGAAFGAGVLMGLSALTRPIGAFLPLVLAPMWALRRGPASRFGLALWFLLGAALPIGGWMAKNQALVGAPLVTIVGDSSLLDYRAAGAMAADEGISLEEARSRVWKRFWSTARPGDGVVQLSRRQRALALEILSEHKWAAVKMAGEGIVRMFVGTGLSALARLSPDAAPEESSGPWSSAAQGLQLLVLAAVYVGAARGVILLGLRRQYLELALTLGVVVYLALLSAGPEAYSRFRFPAVPFLAILAGHGFTVRRNR